jgi:pimeloyl-ACP methyl ester carboxylesterase
MARRQVARTTELADGIAVHAARGEGECVLWLHGYTMDSTIWDELWTLLPSWSHLGIDLPGHGLSRNLGADDDLPKVARTIGQVALAHGVRHLVALSFGTIVGLQVAIEFPDAFESVALAAPALAGGPQDAVSGRRYLELAHLYAEQGAGPHMRRLWMSPPPEIFAGARTRPALWQRLCAVIDAHRWHELRDGAMRALAQPAQTTADLARMRTRLLLLIGEHEIAAFRDCAALIAAAAPRTPIVRIRGAGHLCLLEAPATVVPILEGHLRGRDVAQPLAE